MTETLALLTLNIETARTARAADMKHRYEQGATLPQVGEAYGITGERVRQILKQTYDICGRDGGAALTSRIRRAEFKEKRELRIQNKWGCSYAEYQTLLKHPDKPTYVFIRYRQHAYEYGRTLWNLTLWQWWNVWKDSRKWSKRGRGARAFHMCRIDKNGPYSVNNVQIASCSDNLTAFWANDDLRARTLKVRWPDVARSGA